MPPKKARSAKEREDATKTQESAPAKVEERSTTSQNSSKKRKKDDAATNVPNKATRRSGRGASKPHPSKEQLLNFLLSNPAEELCRPDEESEDIKSRGPITTYAGTVMNPFEELLSAVILSRPISHRLGLRTIRTVFNDPYNFHSARAVQKAGREKVLQAVWDARTQHKDKTAAQISLVADVVLEKFTTSGDKDGTELQKALDDNGGDVDSALDTLQANIKGLGETGVKIFLRRVQWLWTSGFPFVDDRTQQSLRKLDLPEDGVELEKLIEQYWKQLDTKHVAGESEAVKKRRAFVLVLERAVGADLEGKIDNLYAAAADP